MSDVTLGGGVGSGLLLAEVEPPAAAPPAKPANNSSCFAETAGPTLRGFGAGKTGAVICAVDEVDANVLDWNCPAMIVELFVAVDGRAAAAPDVETGEDAPLLVAAGVAVAVGDIAAAVEPADELVLGLLPPPPGATGSVVGNAVSNAPCTVIKSRPVIAPLPYVS